MDSVVPIELSKEVLVLHGQITLGHQPLNELYLLGNLGVGFIPMLTQVKLLLTRLARLQTLPEAQRR